jgi:hypothetical protein
MLLFCVLISVLIAGITTWAGNRRAIMRIEAKMLVRRISEASEEERWGVFGEYGVDGV